MTQSPPRPLIAVIEDNTDLNGIIVNAIRSAGYAAIGHASVECFEQGGVPLADPGTEPPHIFLLDLNLPGEDGLSFARRLRKSRPGVGIVMLTARNEMDQRRDGYDSGADIYLTKPSSVDEILGALGALTRRIGATTPRDEQGGGPMGRFAAAADPAETVLLLSPRKLELSGPNGSVAISATEAALLAHCAANPDGRISIESFADLMPEAGAISKVAIELKIVRLRKKLVAAGFDGRNIGSVRNYGYQLLVPIRVAQG